MSGGTLNAVLWSLSRPDSDADRRRSHLVAGAVTGGGIFLLSALAVLTAPDGVVRQYLADGSVTTFSDPGRQPLAPYVADPQLRPGVVIGALLLVVPFVLFGLQALRTGTAARERRLAALSLAGAGRAQLRRLAFLEGTRAAVIGGLLAGPGYLLLWLLVGVLPPDGTAMLPRPGPVVLAAWPVLVVLLGVAGGLAAGLVARTASLSPLAITRGRPRPLKRAAALPMVLAVVVLLGAPVLFGLGVPDLVLIPTTIAAVVLLTVSGGPWLILVIGRFALRGDLTTSMAGRRLLADVRSPGRVAGVLFTAGFVLGTIAGMTGEALEGYEDDSFFYLGGFGAAAIGALLAVLVAVASLIVGVTEQVLHGRRGIAVLVALAASTDFVHRVVRRQLMLAAVPTTMLGALLGSLASLWLMDGDGSVPTWLILIAAVPFAGLSAMAETWFSARAVRPAVVESSTPDNLRVP